MRSWQTERSYMALWTDRQAGYGGLESQLHMLNGMDVLQVHLSVYSKSWPFQTDAIFI